MLFKILHVLAWIILAFGLLVDLIPALAIKNWTSSKQNPPSATPCVSWMCYLLFCILVPWVWWLKILAFPVLFLAPMFIRAPFIRARAKWLEENGL